LIAGEGPVGNKLAICVLRKGGVGLLAVISELEQ
jgi:hypothetical protein